MTQVKANRLNHIVACIQQGGTDGMTRKQLAECLQLKLTPYLLELIKTVVDAGYAKVTQDQSVYPPVYRYHSTGKAA